MADQVADEIKIQQLVKQLRVALAVLVTVGVLGGAYLLVGRAADKKQEEAFASLYQAEKIEEDAMRIENDQVKAKDLVKDSKNSKEATKVAPGLPRDSFYEIAKSWTDDQRKDYVSKLEETISRYPNTVPQTLASLRLANLSFHIGKLDEAVKYFDSVVSGYRPSQEEGLIFNALAFEGKGALLETQKKWDEAYKNYEAASLFARNPLKPLALLGMARVLRTQGKIAESKTVFDKVISEFPNSDYEKRARALKDVPPQG